MRIQSVSEQKEDPLSTHPVLLLAVWLGVLVVISGIFGDMEGYQSHIPREGEQKRIFLGQLSEKREIHKGNIFEESILNGISPEEREKEGKKKLLEQEIRSLVAGYPIEEMVPFIAEQERVVAAFLVGIAKKESDWGKHVPTKEGRECYNYWGYKGAGSLGHGMGYGCFSDPREAIAIVGGRIHALVIEKKNETPRDMVIWKCGSRSCAGHAPGSAEKWISDVNMYYSKLVAFAK